MCNKLYFWSLLFSIFISQSQTVTQDKKFEETVNGFTFQIDIPDGESHPSPVTDGESHPNVVSDGESHPNVVPDGESHPDPEIGSGYIVEEGNQTKQKAKKNGKENKTKRQAINKSKVIPSFNNNVDYYHYEVDWNLSPEQMVANAQEMLVQCTKQIDAIIAVPKEQRSFENTFQAFADFEAYYQTVSPLGFLSKVSPDPKIRAASNKASSILGKFSIQLGSRTDVYNALKEYQNIAKSNGAYERLDPESQRYMDKVISEMEGGGVNKPEEQRKKIEYLNMEISSLAKEALNNINVDPSVFEIQEQDIENLGNSVINSLEKVPGKQGYRQFPLKSPTTSSVLRLSDNYDVKKKLQQAKDSQAKEKNIPILEELIQKRTQLAHLLNYTSFSAYALDGLMAKNPETVQKFHDDLREKIVDKAKQEILEVNKIKSENMTVELSNPKVKDWDFTFYFNEYSLRQNDIDSNQLSVYFLMENVKKETMDIYEKLLGLTFSKIPEHKSWAKEVTFYEVRDTQTMEVLGHFYLDLYPRKNKFSHAAVFQLIKRAKVDIRIRTPTVAMVTNFKKSLPGKPSLLSHHEMVTFFHEFGHIMHAMCTESNYNRFAGTSVERDFVEMPSQMMENWIHDRDILKKVTKHFKTGKPMPDRLIDSIISKKSSHNAIIALSSIFQGTFDLLIYSAKDQNLLSQPQKLAQNGFEDTNSLRKHIKMKREDVPDTEDLYHTLSEKIQLQKMLPGTNPAAHFGHIISGYESQYYSYLWSLVYSCDIFQHFKEAGLLNAEMGMKYRKIILAPGGSRDSIDLITEFLGREPTIDAYLEMNNFTEKQLKEKVEQVPLYHNQRFLDNKMKKGKK